MGKFWILLSLPKVWILNLIRVQEKKEYNFYVILLFAFFVALMRFTLEFMLSYKHLYLLNATLVATLTFYLQCIFIYTFILWVFIPNFEWKKSINLILIGVFLGVFPPLIDVASYGLGNFNYSYVANYKVDWNFLIFNKEADVPLGEATTLFITMFLVATVVWLKTNSFFRMLGSFVLTYLSVFFYGGLVPLLAEKLSKFMYLDVLQSTSSYIQKGSFENVIEIPLLGFFQILVCLLIYFALNPVVFVRLSKRINHAIPVVLTTLLGYSVYKSIDGYGLFIAAIMFFAALVVVVQNDFFDREEDVIDGRQPYLTKDDVAFFNVMLMLMIALLASAANFSAYMIMLFLVVSFLYNYDFYRGKKYFPSNYKLEGVAGLSAYLAGVSMVITSAYQISGDMLNVNLVLGTTIRHPMEVVLAEIWSPRNLWIAFFIFGGWSILSVIKDYKDIKSDGLVGTQSAYTLLLKRGKDYKKFHKYYTLLLSLSMLIPWYWISDLSVSKVHSIFLVLLCVIFYFLANRGESNRTVALTLGVVNIYLLNLVIAFHSSHIV